MGISNPSTLEMDGYARVTELYLCSSCSRVTRFPRYNLLQSIIGHNKGRCGEYSALSLLICSYLGYKIRYITDITDHLWIEIGIPSKNDSNIIEWIHLDPCEGSVNERLIYQSWGKNQSYIMAYTIDSTMNVSDVTMKYTTKYDIMNEKRTHDGYNLTSIQQILTNATIELVKFREELQQI